MDLVLTMKGLVYLEISFNCSISVSLKVLSTQGCHKNNKSCFKKKIKIGFEKAIGALFWSFCS